MEKEQFELFIAQEVVRNLWRGVKYQNLDINRLLGLVAEGEFCDEAEKFIVEKNKLIDEQLEQAMQYVRSLLPDAEPDDMADLLNVEYGDIEKLILKKQGLKL